MKSIRKITFALVAGLAVIAGSMALTGQAHAGFVDAWGVYHITCANVVVGYDMFGRPIVQTVCN